MLRTRLKEEWLEFGEKSSNENWVCQTERRCWMGERGMLWRWETGEVGIPWWMTVKNRKIK